MKPNLNQLEEIFLKGKTAAENGECQTALIYFSQISGHSNDPEIQSCQAYCLARMEGRIQAALKLCHNALQKQPANSLHHLMLGRILLIAGQREKAITTFRQGLRQSPNPTIMNELKRLGLRKPAIIKGLDRSHPLNKTLGKLFSTIGLR